MLLRQTAPRESHLNKSRLLKLAALAALSLLLLPLSGKGLAYVFSGGGARGFAQLGMLKVIEEEGMYPDYVIGSSVGSLMGALYSMGYSAAEVESLMIEANLIDAVFERQIRGDLFDKDKRWPDYGTLRLPMSSKGIPRLPEGFISGALIDQKFSRLFLPASPYRDFNKLPIAFVGHTIDMHTGELILHREGSLEQAVRGASSIPVIIGPFPYDGITHIDGGLLQNLPAVQALEVGADKVLGLKINFPVKGNDPRDLYSILNHIINIGMHTSIDANLELCDLVLEPDLTGNISIEYYKAKKISQIGEDYARQNIDIIRAFRDSLLAEGYAFKKPQKVAEPDTYHIESIICRENLQTPCTDIIKLCGLKEGFDYTPDQILDACVRVWNSKMFYTVYPVLEPSQNGYTMVIYVRERDPRYLHLDLSYNNHDRFSIGLLAEFNNVLFSDSKLLAGLSLGGNAGLNLDFVKDFGQFNAPYLRFYPWIQKTTVQRFDALGNCFAALDSLDVGFLPAVGVFLNKFFSAELFGYASRSKLYNRVAPNLTEHSWQKDGGWGLKLYHESVDSDLFPRRGARVFLKYNHAPWAALSDVQYQSASADCDFYAPLAKPLSLRFGFSMGSHFGNADENTRDLFHYGGSQGFMGYQRDQMPSSEYKYATLSAVFNPAKILFLEAGAQALNTDGIKTWNISQDLIWAWFASAGIDTPAGPICLKLALREDGKTNFFFNVGYDKDFFRFSRK
jgi:predicted acylesterase/phospholipase RssA